MPNEKSRATPRSPTTATSGEIRPTRFQYTRMRPDFIHRQWKRLAKVLTRRPGAVWLTSVALMAPLALAGLLLRNHQSYDFIGSLPDSAPSVSGTKVLQEHFPTGLLGPVTVLLVNPSVDFATTAGQEHVATLTARLERQELGLADIRTLTSPLGITEAARRARHGRVPPLSLRGPMLCIRRFGTSPLHMKDLVSKKAFAPEMGLLMESAVKARLNIIISGGTGSGKTTLLNALSSFISRNERIVTIEDAAELQLQQPHVVQLESRPPNIEGKGQITIRDLVRNALRMRPDRIVIGECRGPEALDMLQAMNTGHEGSLTTLHANSPRDGLARLETMIMMTGFELPIRAMREQIASALDLIIQANRLQGGGRRVTSITASRPT